MMPSDEFYYTKSTILGEKEIPAFYFTPKDELQFEGNNALECDPNDFWLVYADSQLDSSRTRVPKPNVTSECKSGNLKCSGTSCERNSGDAQNHFNEGKGRSSRERSNVRLRLPPRWHQVVFLISLITLTSLCQVSEECPVVCECKWKSGKESVVCSNAKSKLTSVPSGLDPGTQLLDLSRNNIQALQTKVFHNRNLSNLQKIFLNECNLKKLESKTFYKLNNLVELDLSGNRLDAVPTHTFEQIPELRELKLNANPISRISNNAFSGLTRLVRLELSKCRITTVDSAAFRALVSLEWLKLDNNRLSSVQVASFYPLRNLHGLEIHGNPWNCSCTLQPLKDWMSKNNVPYGVPPVCSEPSRVNGKSWDQLQREDFACVPKVQGSIRAEISEVTKVIEGENATLVCRLQATADTKVRWMNANKPIPLSPSRYSLSESFVQDGDKTITAVPTKQTLGTKTSRLTVIRARQRDSGTYNCRAESRAGSVSTNFTLEVFSVSAERFTGRFILYGATVAALATLVVCFLLLYVIFYCGKKKSRILWDEKVELPQISRNGPVVQNGHTIRNGGTTIPLLRMNNINGDMPSTVDHCETPKAKKQSPSPPKDKHSGLLNTKYKALPTKEAATSSIRDHAEDSDSSSDIEDNDKTSPETDAEPMNNVRKKSSIFPLVKDHTPESSGSSSSTTKFPDLLHEGKVKHNIPDSMQLQTRPKALLASHDPSPSPGGSNVVLETSNSCLDNSHRPQMKPGLSLVPNGNTTTSLEGLPPSITSSQPRKEPQLPTRHQPNPGTMLTTKFTFNQPRKPPPPPIAPRHQRTSSFSHMNPSSHPPPPPPPHQIPRNHGSSVMKQYSYNECNNTQQSTLSPFPFQRRSMPTSPLHYPSPYPPRRDHNHHQGSDPALIVGYEHSPTRVLGQPQEYDYHAVRLAAFLEEYRQLQLELMRMSASLTEMDPVVVSSGPTTTMAANNNVNINLNSNAGSNVATNHLHSQHMNHHHVLRNSGVNNNNYLV